MAVSTCQIKLGVKLDPKIYTVYCNTENRHLACSLKLHKCAQVGHAKICYGNYITTLKLFRKKGAC